MENEGNFSINEKRALAALKKVKKDLGRGGLERASQIFDDTRIVLDSAKIDPETSEYLGSKDCNWAIKTFAENPIKTAGVPSWRRIWEQAMAQQSQIRDNYSIVQNDSSFSLGKLWAENINSSSKFAINMIARTIPKLGPYPALSRHLKSHREQLDCGCSDDRKIVDRLHSKRSPFPNGFVGGGPKRSESKSVHYASLTDFRGSPRPISKEEYSEIIKGTINYDLVIDGMGSCAYMKSNGRVRRARLTVTEFYFIKSYIKSSRPRRPIEFSRGHDSNAKAAIKFFERARQKVDSSEGRQNWKLFKTHKRQDPEFKAFEFDPPNDFFWALINPIL